MNATKETAAGDGHRSAAQECTSHRKSTKIGRILAVTEPLQAAQHAPKG